MQALKLVDVEGSASRKTPNLDYASTHRDVVERCKHGNRQAQFELYRLYSRAMYNLCLRMLRNEQDAEDVLQRSFIDVFSHLDSFRYQSSVGAWIKRIVVNNCINHLKRNKIHIEELEPRHVPVEDEPVTLVEDDMDVYRIKRAVSQLPDGYRTVFTLYLFEGYDHQEISEIMGITEATSKSQLSRAKQKVKQILTQERTRSNR